MLYQPFNRVSVKFEMIRWSKRSLNLIQRHSEEWTTSKKVVNHKTRQTETRVQRHIVMEDGKVIADSGPQVTSRTKEDATTEESEDSKKSIPPPTARPPAVLASGHIRVPGTQTVLDETTSTRSKTKSSRVENAQYHDEDLKELTGFEVHKKAISAPNELISLSEAVAGSAPAGKLVHFSVNGQKVKDVEETKSSTRKDMATGESRTETTKTYHQEVHDEDESPNREGYDVVPQNFSNTSRNMTYYQNYSDDDEEDCLARKEMQRKAMSHVIRVHDSSGWRGDSPDPGEYRFTKHRPAIREHDSSSSSGSSRSSVVQAGGNVIKIELSGSRSSSVMSNGNGYNRRERISSPPLPEPDYETHHKSVPRRTFYFGSDTHSGRINGRY